MQKLSFSNIKYKDLKKVVNIKQLVDDSQFNDWFSNHYEFSEEELAFLKTLIHKNRLKVKTYTEEELKAKFIIPLLNKVDFQGENYSDWYERTIKTVINGWEIGGLTDFMIAKGEREPETPYFFIQEFKPSKTSSYPEEQLIAELLVALHLNKETLIKGAYIVGEHWYFVITQRDETDNYQYFVSESFDSLKLEDLKRIYQYLQTIKSEVLKKSMS